MQKIQMRKNSIKVCIIDDEPEIRKLMRKIIEKQDDFQVVAENGDFASAVSDFAKYKPDVAFVDIDLNGDSGLECAKVLTQLNPKVKIIFATAHSEYMANAFEIYAFDYLVKPFNIERVVQTLSRIREEEAENIVSTLYNDKIMIKGKDQIAFIDTKEIILAERCENMTQIVTEDECFRTSLSLTNLEEKLDPREFMRCHKSYIVHLDKISKIEPYGRWTYVVKFKGSNETALMTAEKYDEIKKIFQ